MRNWREAALQPPGSAQKGAGGAAVLQGPGEARGGTGCPPAALGHHTEQCLKGEPCVGAVLGGLQDQAGWHPMGRTCMEQAQRDEEGEAEMKCYGLATAPRSHSPALP